MIMRDASKIIHLLTKLLTQASRQSGKALDSAETERLESTNWSKQPTEPTKSTKFLDKPILKFSLVFKYIRKIQMQLATPQWLR